MGDVVGHELDIARQLAAPHAGPEGRESAVHAIVHVICLDSYF